MFKKILVPVDFTPKNKAAIDASSELASANHGEVILLHVIERLDLLPSRETRGFYNRLKRNGETKIRKLAKKLGRNMNVKTDIVFGNRAEEIVQYSIDHETDVIVMASHKINPSSPNKGWGTISYKVAILSQCPVLLVK